MQDQKDNSQTNAADAAGAANTAVNRAAQGDFIQKIIEKIKSSENILIALSRDPSVDEIAAAIGLAMFLDGMQKHATAIYSGRTPDALAFLQPNETFEKNTDSLQDFIIALNKDKADHLRYKLEGDFVKVFVTPYKTKITQEDLQFSYGDFNVDFVIAINVASAGNLDEALREHGRIMHDAAVVNITTGEPGRFGEIEWSNPVASSLCEMMTELIFTMQDPEEKPLERDVATALLTGIVAATDRFSNNRTNSDTLGIASKLMSMGADQQLISSNVSGNDIVHNEPGGFAEEPKKDAVEKKTNLTIEHDESRTSSLVSAMPNGVLADALKDSMAGNGAGTSSGAAGSAVNPAMNPAVQAAPSVSADANASTNGMISATNDVTPENVVVQPVIPGVNGVPVDQMIIPGANGGGASVGASPSPNPVVAGNVNTNAGVGQGASPSVGVNPSVGPNPGQMQVPGGSGVAGGNAAGTAGAVPPRPMATSAPEMPATKQVGSTIQPPAPTPKKTKNYAEMMEEALSEGLPQDKVNAPGMAGVPAVPTGPVADATTMNLPGVQNTGMVDAGANLANPANPMPVMEPVANPMNGAVLPPPPAPEISSGNGGMPPILPPVQI